MPFFTHSFFFSLQKKLCFPITDSMQIRGAMAGTGLMPLCLCSSAPLEQEHTSCCPLHVTFWEAVKQAGHAGEN